MGAWKLKRGQSRAVSECAYTKAGESIGEIDFLNILAVLKGVIANLLESGRKRVGVEHFFIGVAFRASEQNCEPFVVQNAIVRGIVCIFGINRDVSKFRATVHKVCATGVHIFWQFDCSQKIASLESILSNLLE